MAPSLLAALVLSASPMEAGMRGYFAGETRESFAFMGFGVVGLGAGVPMFVSHDPVLRPMSIPIMALGVVQLALGIGLLARTSAQVARLAEQLTKEPAAYREAEGTRMRGVMAGFQAYRLFELTVGVTGAVMAGIGHARDEPMVLGVGLGMLVEAAAMLLLDSFAEERGRAYSALIAGFLP
jgi:hypothetical protein